MRNKNLCWTAKWEMLNEPFHLNVCLSTCLSVCEFCMHVLWMMENDLYLYIMKELQIFRVLCSSFCFVYFFLFSVIPTKKKKYERRKKKKISTHIRVYMNIVTKHRIFIGVFILSTSTTYTWIHKHFQNITTSGALKK